MGIMKNRNIVILCGALVMLTTGVIYLLSCGSLFKAPICWLALIFTLLSELLTTSAFALSKGDPRRVGGAIACLIHTVVTLILSVLFINLPLLFLMLKTFVAVNITTFAAAIIVTIILFNFAENKNAERSRLAGAKKSILRCRAVVQSMINSEAGRKYASQLKNLDEDLRFMDDGVTDLLDDQILSQLESLSAKYSSEDFPVEDTIARIRDTIRQRNFLVKNGRSCN